uniref:Uncharacterized protein n=1 Tax=Arundo donax TaxID=35708 RepID=A0A0A8ZJ20_ARUDO
MPDSIHPRLSLSFKVFRLSYVSSKLYIFGM